jgi:hypothetical protein
MVYRIVLSDTELVVTEDLEKAPEVGTIWIGTFGNR